MAGAYSHVSELSIEKKKKQAIAKPSPQCLHMTNEEKDTKSSNQLFFPTGLILILKVNIDIDVIMSSQTQIVWLKKA